MSRSSSLLGGTDTVDVSLTELRMLAPVDYEVIIYECEEYAPFLFLMCHSDFCAWCAYCVFQLDNH